MTYQLITPVTSSPAWRLLRLRFGTPVDRALVFLSEQGLDRLEPPRGGDFWGYPRPTVREVRRGVFFDIVEVSLAERRFWVDIPRRTATPAVRPRSRYEVAWKISNPVVAARARVGEEEAHQRIVRHIGEHAALPGVPDPLKQPPPHYGTAQVEPPGQLRVIDEAGLVYWFLDPPDAFLTAPGTGAVPTLPPAFGEAHREAYRFYREVVAGGPVGLAALWLLHQPEQAREVLDWTVTHSNLLTDRDGWERALAATLQGLSEEDRGFVGVNLARVLSDVGVPQGDEILRRIGHNFHHDVNGAHGEPL
ncbi:hypothetical protein [Streptomyces sp. AK02-01A]|uniref:hypothetical protein n=1 Tax=Streptomyces sp. AK02-01A TaxID=3028648 RepID=UPI0029AE5309|nr:hypothetical protein [Streptomyces sp. AK02-01A]MDX3851058.1 hypothetical protein [Streptomyces sp. AK02-01A]